MTPKILRQGKTQFEDIHISQSNSNRKISKELENESKVIWKEVEKWANDNNVDIWDSHLYRLNSYKSSNDKLELDLGLIPFSKVRGIKNNTNLVNYDQSYYPMNIFISGLIYTSDGFSLFGIKGKNTTSSNRNQLELIGGVLSKEEVEINTGDDIKKALYEELKEEVNIEENEVVNSELLGMIQTEYGSIGLISGTELNLTKDECIKIFNDRDEDEIQDLVFAKREETYLILKKARGFRKLIIDLL